MIVGFVGIKSKWSLWKKWFPHSKYVPVWPLVKNECVGEKIRFGVISPSVILLSFSIVVIVIGLSLVLFVRRDADEKWLLLLLLLFNERLVGMCGFAADFVVDAVTDDKGVLVENIWLVGLRIEDDDDDDDDE